MRYEIIRARPGFELVYFGLEREGVKWPDTFENEDNQDLVLEVEAALERSCPVIAWIVDRWRQTIHPITKHDTDAYSEGWSRLYVRGPDGRCIL